MNNSCPDGTGTPGVIDYTRSMYWDYDQDGQLTAVRDLNGQRELYSYDSDGNQTLAIEADGIEQASQSPIRIERTFDGFDEPTQTRVPDPSSPGRYLATSYQYDLDGNTTGQVVNLQEDQGGSQTAAGRAFAYTYNDVDQVTAQTDDWSSGTPAEELTYTYTPTGQLSSRLLAGQTGSWTPEQEADYSYYQNGLLEQLSNYSGSAQSGTLVEQHTLSYIKNGVYMNGDQVSDSFMLAGPDASAPCRTSASTCTAGWTYDAKDRLISEDPGSGSGAKTYTLDAAGDVLSDGSTQSTYSGQRLVSQTTGGVTIKYLYDALGNVACQVTSAWTQATCPAAGNAALLQSYTYDYKNRLIADTSYDGSGNVTASASYVLDALDRTVSETETHSGATTTTQTVYQGDSSAVSKETLSGAQSETKTYAYDALGNAITLSDATGGTTNRYSYLYDPRSSVSMLLDSTGAAKESYGYTAYGSKNASISKSASGFSTGSVPTNPVRFQGKRFDSGSGSYDMGARRYSATTGRWLSQDIYYGALDNLGLSQDPLTANRYAFLGANPINYVEADGHVSEGDAMQTFEGVGGESLVQEWEYGGKFDPEATRFDKENMHGTAYARNLRVWNSEHGLDPETGMPITAPEENGEHGNSKLSTKQQHLYEISEKETGKVHKYGVSGDRITQDGRSYRAQRQVNVLNRANEAKGISTRYTSRIIDYAENRADILEKERTAVRAFKDLHGESPRGNLRPKV